MEEINIKLAVFEGPLDLLLHLIKQLEIDVYDIPIAAITEQYMAYIHTMKFLALEVAGEYLVMAATLMAIKSQMLLPKQELAVEIEEYEEDPRDVLVAQLVEYRKYKYAAEQLSEKAEERSLYYTKDPMDVDAYKAQDDHLTANQFNTIDLFMAFQKMIAKKKNRQVLETKITPDENTIDEKMAAIQMEMQHISAKKGRPFDSFFDSYIKSEVVVTFMALLELMKKGTIRVEQDDNFSSIMLYPTGTVNE